MSAFRIVLAQVRAEIRAALNGVWGVTPFTGCVPIPSLLTADGTGLATEL